MIERTIDKLVGAFQALADNGSGAKEAPMGAERRFAMATAVSTGTTPRTVTVTLSGSSVTIPCIGDYTPAVNDKVLILQEGTDYVALGTLTRTYSS